MYINFYSLGRNFKLKLLPTKSKLFEKEYIEVDTRKHSINDNLFYDGGLVDEPNSRVTGSIIDGVFYGTIKTENGGTYHIESSRRYNGSFTSHSIIYHEDDLMLNNTLKKRDTSHSHSNHAGCASKNVFDSLQKIQEEAFIENVKAEVSF